MIWSELVRLAILGGNRSTLPDELKLQLEAQGIHTDTSFPEMMLESVALYNQVRKAAFPLKTFQGTLPSPIPETEGTACSPRSANHLQIILRGRFAPALEEFISILQQKNKKIPAESLPDLFNASLTEKKLWELLRPVIGTRGEWLLTQIPEWAPLVEVADIKNWEKGSIKEKAAILHFLRKNNPKQSIDLLTPIWSNLASTDKSSLLKSFHINPGKSDEAFLEQLLDDKIKKVRLEAAQILAKIPGSTLIDRLFTALLELVHVTDNSIEFEIPESLPESTLRDGIYPIPLKGMKGGMKAAWLRQIISKIPPERWTELLDKPEDECLQFFVNSQWADHLIPALTESALNFKNDGWLITLMEHFHQTGNSYGISVNLLKEIIKHLPAKAIHYLIDTFQETAPRLIENKSLFFLVITESRFAWTDKFTINLLQNFKNWMRNTSDNFLSIDHYRAIFETGAYSMNPRLIEKFKMGWPTRNKIWYYWEDTIDKLTRTLAFRKEMIDELRRG